MLAFSAAQLVLGLVSARVLTQVTPPNTLGEYYLLMNLAAWLVLPTSSSYLYIWRNWTVARVTGQTRTFSRAIWRGLLSQFAVCALGTVPIGLLGLGRVHWFGLLAVSLTAVGLATNQALDQIQTLERRRGLAGLLGLAATPLRQFALAAAVLVLSQSTGESLLVAQAGYGLVAAGLSVVLFRKAANAPLSPSVSTRPATAEDALTAFPRFVRFAAPFLVNAIVLQVAASAERWGLALRAAPDATALFVQATGVALAATGAVALPVNTYFLPIISQAAAQSANDPIGAARKPFKRFIVLNVALMALATVAMSVLAPLVAHVFFGPRYSGVAPLLPWAMAGQSLFAIGQALSLVPVSVDATRGVAAAFALARLTYVAVLVFIPCPWNCALWFVQCFTAGNLVYLVAILAVVARTSQEMVRRRPSLAATP